METKDFGKEKIVRMMACVISLLLGLSFFVPWVSSHDDITVQAGGEVLQIHHRMALSILEADTGDILTISGEAVEITPEVVASVNIETTRHYSAFELARGVDFPYFASFPIVFLLPVIPLAIAILVLTKSSFKKLSYIAISGIVAITIFNMYFVHGLDYRQNVETASLFWLVAAAYAVLLALLFFGAMQKKEFKSEENISPPYVPLQKTIISASVLSLAIVVSLMTTIPIFAGGIMMMRISFTGIFHNIVAIMFGPFYGGTVRALSDIIMFNLRPPGGPYLWPLTVTAFFRGVLIAIFWIKIRNIRPKAYSVGYTVICVFLLIFGAANLISVLFFPDSAYTVALGPEFLSASNRELMPVVLSYGFAGTGAIGLLVQFLIYKLTIKKYGSIFYERFIKLFVAIGIPGFIISTINTYILFVTVVGMTTINAGFMFYWLPRIFNETVTNLLNVYILVILMGIYEKAMKRRIVQSTEKLDEKTETNL